MVDMPHYYIYDVQQNSSIANNYAFGDMVIEGNNLIKKYSWHNYDDFADDMEQTFHLQPNDNKGLIIYIHGYQADNPFFMRRSGYIIQRKILDRISPPYGVSLSLQWSSGIPYGKSVDTAYTKGQKFAPLLMDIMLRLRRQYANAPVSFICHSMGNRVYQGLYDAFLQMNSDFKFNDIFLMAADLESNIFELAFKNIELHTTSLLIYQNRQDVTLKIANTMIKNPRLGLSGTLHYYQPTNSIIRDITEVDDDNSFGGKYTHHRYFYGSATVRNEIIKKLSGIL